MRAARFPAILGLILCCAAALVQGRDVVAQDEPVDEKTDEKIDYPKWKAGEQEGKVTIDGKEESFVALVPKKYTPKKAWAAVLLAHGNGGKAASFLSTVKSLAGKSPPLLISLERIDNNQDAVGYLPKYLDELRKQFHLDEANLFCLGFSGGGFRIWDDVVAKADQVGRFRGIVLVGSAKQSFEPADKPARAPTVILVGDPEGDSNFKEPGPAARKDLEAKGYEVVVHEHRNGHSMSPKELKAVMQWISELAAGKTPKVPGGDSRK